MPERDPARRRAATTLAATLIVVTVLGLIGAGVEDHLRPTSLAISGTSSARGEALARDRFGQSSPLAVLLRGPAASVARQGRHLATVLRGDPTLTVISPWDPAPAARKLPAPAPDAPPGSPSNALLLLDFHIPLTDAMRDTVPRLEDTLDSQVHPPVRATQSGFATISRALQHESLAAAERAELLAAPLLLLVLLLVFRSVLAALIPLVFGAITVFAGRGVLVFLTSLIPIDALSLVVCTMMGLALGVDYSLLIVSRFREELATGSNPSTAAARTRRSAGRTTAIAGATLFFSIFLSAFFQPGSLLVSLAAALAVVTAIAVLIASASLPALLTLLGPRINAGRVGRSRPGAGRSRVAAAASAAIRRPAIASVAIVVPLLLLSAPALAFDTGSPGVDELSSSSSAREDSEAISAAVGPGWQAPFILTVTARRGPVTARHHLGFLAATQHRIDRLADVDTVIGPAQVAAAAGPLRSLASQLEPGDSSPTSQLSRLGPQLNRASGAVSELRGGLAEASAAGGLLSVGSARAGEGADLLAGGLAGAGEGGERASGALDRLASGSERLAKGQQVASGTARNLSLGLGTLLPNLTAQGLARARSLSGRLHGAAAADPSLAPAAHEAEVLASVLATNREELARLRAQAKALNTGLGKLTAGGERLHGGSAALATEAQRLSGGLGELRGGAEELSGGLGALSGGAEQLSSGLAEGFRRSYPLQKGLGHAGSQVTRGADSLDRRLSQLQRLSPGLFDSGYLALAALDGADSTPRSLAAEVIDVSGGGTAARYLIVPHSGFNTSGSRQLGSRLGDLASVIDARPPYSAGLSGGAAVLNDYGSATKSRLPLVVGSIVLITFLMLLALLRAPLLAALAVGLNLLSVAAAIGVVTLACKIPAGYPLGGHPYIDTVGAAAIFGVTFGLSIDYAVFLLARMREKYVELSDASFAGAANTAQGSPAYARTREGGRDISGGDQRARPGAEDMRGIDSEDMRPAEANRAAIRFGLDKTAGVITGAAAIMAAVFASFAIAPVATVSQMGLGLTVAILLDATVVRIVLLPALMLLIGDRVWRTPKWLDRLLPSQTRKPVPTTAEATS